MSLENVGDANFSVVVNWRRQKDQFIRQEGWSKFWPVSGQPVTAQWIFDGAESLLRLGELIRANGTKLIIGASRTKIKYYDTATAAWVVIGTGFSASGLRWQFLVINGTAVLNNTINLPVYYKIGDAAVTPLYELRQVGVSSVGRIVEYNGFLHLLDVTEIDSVQLNTWMNGYGSYTISSTVAKVAGFAVLAPADNQKEFSVTTAAAAITATLPAAPGLATFPFYFWLKKADNGAGTVITSPVIADQAIVLATINDRALVWWNGTAWAAKKFASGTIPATDPYGIPPTDILNNYPDEVAWGTIGDPVNWSPVFSAVQLAAGTVIYVPFVPSTWVAGQTRVAVINAGADGGVLGGDSLHPDGILVTAIGAFDPAHNGAPLTLELTTDTLITYPRVVALTRWTDTTSFVGKQYLGNGQRIIGGAVLQGQLFLYQTGGIWVSRYTAVASAPFAIRPKYTGKNVPILGDCIVDVNGDYHLYAAEGNRFYGFDGVTEPEVHKSCDDARDVFFSNLDVTAEPFAVDNPLTKQIWFYNGAAILAFDYESQQSSKIDSVLGAATIATKPGGTDQWFVLGIANHVFQYGLVNGVGTTWLRDGAAAVPVVKSGLVTFGTQYDEKDLLSITPVLASPSPDMAISVDILTTWNPSAAPISVVSGGVALPDPEGNNFVTTLFRAIYMQHSLTVTDARDMDIRLSAFLFEVDLVKAGGVTRAGTT